MIRSIKWGTSTCGEQRGMVYLNVIKVSLIPRRELNYVVKTDKGERGLGENIVNKKINIQIHQAGVM